MSPASHSGVIQSKSPRFVRTWFNMAGGCQSEIIAFASGNSMYTSTDESFNLDRCRDTYALPVVQTKGTDFDPRVRYQWVSSLFELPG